MNRVVKLRAFERPDVELSTAATDTFAHEFLERFFGNRSRAWDLPRQDLTKALATLAP